MNIILLSLLLFSCGKKTAITGRIINPVPGSMEGTGGKLIETTTTDSEGYYVIDIRKSSSRNYYLSVIYDTKKCTSNKSTSVEIASKTKNQSFDFSLIPYGYLKEKINNVTCFDDSDLLSIKRLYNFPPLYSTSNSV